MLGIIRCSGVLQTAWESDQIETWVSEKSWNLQGWLSVGSHKLVQQTLRALVRGCSHPYAVRTINRSRAFNFLVENGLWRSRSIYAQGTH